MEISSVKLERTSVRTMETILSDILKGYPNLFLLANGTEHRNTLPS